MTKKTRRTLLLSFLALALIGASIGYYLYNKGPVCVKCTDGKKVTATELYRAYSKDSTTAKKEYTGKILEITGMASRISQNMQDQSVILIKTEEAGAAVNCTLEGPIGDAKEGTPVVIKGICTGIGAGDADLGILGDVYITRCYLVK